MKLWDPADQTEVGLVYPERVIGHLTDDTDVTSMGFSVQIELHTVIPRMVGCMMMCRLDERGLPEALEAINDVAQFYSDVDAHELLAVPSDSAPVVKGRIAGSEVRPSLNYSE